MTFRINDFDGHKRAPLGGYGQKAQGSSDGVESLTQTLATRVKGWTPPKPARYVLVHGANVLWTSDFTSLEACQHDGSDFTLNYRHDICWNQSLGLWIGYLRGRHDNADRMYRSTDGKTWEAGAASKPASGGWFAYHFPGMPAFPSVGSRIYVLYKSSYTTYPNVDVKIQYTDDAFDTVHDVPGASWSGIPSSHVNSFSVSPNGKYAIVLFDKSPIEYVVSTDFDQPTPTWSTPDISALSGPGANMTVFNDGKAYGVQAGTYETYFASNDGSLSVFTKPIVGPFGINYGLAGVAEMVDPSRIIALRRSSTTGYGRVWDKSQMVGNGATLNAGNAVAYAASGCKPQSFCWDPSGEHILGCKAGLICRTLDDGLTWETPESIPGLAGDILILAQNPNVV
jgi:hypothetical protein